MGDQLGAALESQSVVERHWTHAVNSIAEACKES